MSLFGNKSSGVVEFNKMNKVRVRIAPSPTGFAHIGTGYTALFNWAFAKKNKGAFVVRVEDSDTKRNVKGAEEAIFKGLEWLGLDWDEGGDKGGPYGPYKLSDRLDIYKKKVDELIEKGLAYEDGGAVRFKNPGKDVSWKDLIRGDITFPGSEITDFVIFKSDGFPTYNLAVVVDDILMEITHVIRGEEHISNTPRQLALYHAFGAKPPLFAHHVTLRGADRKKLSKRRDPVNLEIYQEEGYLSEALVNFLSLLGWSHPEEKEIFSLEEFGKLFDFKRMRKAGPVFDKDKLDWMNSQYIQNLTDRQLVEKLDERNKDYKSLSVESKLEIARLTKTRIKTLSEFDSLASFFFGQQKVDKNLLGANHKNHLKTACDILKKIDKWSLDIINTSLTEEIKKNNYKTGDFFMDLRIAITGSKFTPPINESIEILGRKETIKRLEMLI